MLGGLFPESIFGRKLHPNAERRLRLSQARAEETIIRAHVDNALMFVDTLAEDLSFDRAIGDLWIGDVGQGAWEEIDFQAAPAPRSAPAAGTNWGWNVLEGTHCFAVATCDATGKAPPIAEYPHAEGFSVTGGFVYRGVVMPDLAATGTYFYGDFGSGFVRSLRMVNGVAAEAQDLTSRPGAQDQLSSFGEDACGELYLVRLSGTVAKVVPAR